MGNTARNDKIQQNASPETPLATVLGWTAVTFGGLPLVMGIHGDGHVYIGVGVALIIIGMVSIVIGKRHRPSAG